MKQANLVGEKELAFEEVDRPTPPEKGLGYCSSECQKEI